VLDRVSIPADLRFVRLGSRGVGHRRRHALEEKFGPRLCWR
jgi:hypothetical protein